MRKSINDLRTRALNDLNTYALGFEVLFPDARALGLLEDARDGIPKFTIGDET